MRVQIFVVPFDSGYRDVRMGLGPAALLDAGLEGELRRAGHEVAVHAVEPAREWRAEISTTFDLYAVLAERIRLAREDGDFPLTLSGNCGATVAALAAIGSAARLVWFDCHGDFNTPETSTSGFLDGMCLAVLTGRCWRPLARTIPGFQPLAERRVLHVGARDFDAPEAEALAGSGVRVVGPERVREHGPEDALGPILEEMAAETRAVYVHIDHDVLDPDEARGNSYATAGGLTIAETLGAIETVARRSSLVGATLAAYEPACDPDRKAARAGVAFATAICAAAAR
jgi:arginase